MVCAGLLVATRPAHAEPVRDDAVVAALERQAHPLRSTEPAADLGDLRPFGRMVADAVVVGIGEAAHSSHDFVTMKHRLYRYLVSEKGFTTFSIEASWSSGLLLNEYVLHGKGDPRQIMRAEFQQNYMGNTREYLDLIEWMRDHNKRHRTKVQFMGNDIGYPGAALFDQVTRYLQRRHPGLLPTMTGLYEGLRPAQGVGAWMSTYRLRPLAERRAHHAQAQQALELLRRQGPGPDRAEFAWAVQHARVIAQVFTLWSADFADPAGATAGFRFREQAMADNITWWQRRTGHKIVLSAHNGHVAHASFWTSFPQVEGTYLRERLGPRYVSVGLTFNEGSFDAYDPADGRLRTVTLGPAPEGGNEHLLDQARHRDYVLDLRTTAGPLRSWLSRPRPTRVYAESYPAPDTQVALGRSYDVVIHLHRLRAAHRL